MVKSQSNLKEQVQVLEQFRFTTEVDEKDTSCSISILFFFPYAQLKFILSDKYIML